MIRLGDDVVALYVGPNQVARAYLGEEEIAEGEEPEPGDFARTASTNITRSIHSGHSLTDAYYNSSWPGTLPALRNSLMDPDDFGETHVVKSTIPGSPMHWRWNNSTEPLDAREDIDQFDTLMITEGIPPRTTNEYMANTLDYLCRFAANTIENGAGNEVILWSIWPAVNGPGTSPENPTPTGEWAGFTFRSGLDEYWKSFKYMADYTSWKMRQLYPSLPSDWRVWLFPGDRWMARVYDDIQLGLVPGITDIADVFDVDIHPTNIVGYGLGCLVITCLYQVNLQEEEDVYIRPAEVDEPAITQAQAEYFWQIAWEIANTYEPVGMGGNEGAALEWTPVNGDLMPNWTFEDPSTDPEPEEPEEPIEPGDMPEFFLQWDATGYDGPELTGPMPTVENGLLHFNGGRVETGVGDFGTEHYFIIAFRKSVAFDNPGILDILRLSTDNNWWSPAKIFLLHGHFNGPHGLAAVEVPGSPNPGDFDYTTGDWEIIEAVFSAEDSSYYRNGVLSGTGAAASEQVVQVYMGIGSEIATHDWHVAAIGICDYIPTPEERAAARAWAQDAVPA